MHEACIYAVSCYGIAVMVCNGLVAMEVCLEKKDTNKCDRGFNRYGLFKLPVKQ